MKGKIPLLKEMLKDDFYSYDTKFIIKFIEMTLKNRDEGMSIHDSQIRLLIN